MNRYGLATPRVFLDVVPHDIRSRNTDWRYVRFMLPRLSEWQPNLELIVQRSARVTAQANYKVLRQAFGKRIGHPLTSRQLETDTLDRRELLHSDADVIFSHRGFPTNAGNVPVIWQSTVLDPLMIASYFGDLLTEIQQEIDVRHELFRRATLVQVSTEAEARRLGAALPDLARRFVPIPFFLPDLHAVDRNELERHQNPESINLLFVGNDARRKGLDLLINAFMTLPKPTQQRAHLTIITNFDGVPVKIPESSRLTVLRGVPHADVLAIMSHAHVLVNVARFESYGFIFLEAMSRGAACIAPDWEVQRELLNDGKAGLNIVPDTDAIRSALVKLIEDDEYRSTIALAGWTRYKEVYSAPIVARQYAAMFQSFASADIA